MSFDPYAPSAYSAAPVAPSGQAIDPAVVQALLATRPWVRLCSVLGFVGAALIFLAAVAMFIGGLAMSSRPRGMGFGGFSLGAGIVYLLVGILYLFPAMKLWRYAGAITRLTYSASVYDLVAALDAQRSFWKFVGILICIVLAVYAVIFVGLIVSTAGMSRF